jgi:hypothetical protein
MHDEATRRHGREVFEAGRDPVFCLDGVEGDALRRCFARRKAHHLADRAMIGRLGKMQADSPAPIRPLERRDRGGAVIKALVKQIDDVPRGRLIADGEGRAVG